MHDSRLTVTSDIMSVVVSVPLSMSGLIADNKVKTSELAKTLVSPSSVVLCNTLTQQLRISVLHRMRK